MDFFKSINTNSGRAIYNFARATSAHAALPLGGLFIARQASFFFICAGDSAGTGYRPRVMPRPELHKFGIIPSILNENFESLIHSVRGKEAQKIWDKSLGFMWIQNRILLKFQIYKEKDENKAE